MRARASELAASGPDPDWSEVYALLELPPPDAGEMAPFLGRWEGVVDVPRGVSARLLLTFAVEDGVVVARGRATTAS